MISNGVIDSHYARLFLPTRQCGVNESKLSVLHLTMEWQQEKKPVGKDLVTAVALEESRAA